MDAAVEQYARRAAGRNGANGLMITLDPRAASKALVVWYAARKRAFPWREEPTAYRIWISEIMLQQTRIEAALPYFERFMAALPTVRDLAAVDEDRLMKLWEGLGYYSRARNLKKAAQTVVRECGGELPASYERLLALPGIGEYTAGAIASIAFGLPVPAIDGNVLRVIARLTNDDGDVLSTPVKRRMGETVRAMLPEDTPGDFNQALMELGETVCLPNTSPLCGRCPLAPWCKGRETGDPARLPVRRPKKERRVEERTVLIVIAKERVLLRRRPPQGLLAGLWELPAVEGWITPEAAAAVVGGWGGRPTSAELVGSGKHLFSHVEWRMRGVLMRTPAFALPERSVWADARELREEAALPSAFRPFSSRLIDWL